MKIRKALPNDIFALLLIEQANFKERAFTRRQFKGYIESGHTYVVDDRGFIAGYIVVFLRSGSRTARINVVSVDPAITGKGYGTKLLDYVEQLYVNRPWSCAFMSLEVNIQNIRAITLYERRGYVEVKRMPDFYGPETIGIKMIKSLK